MKNCAALLDHLIELLKLKNDAALARALEFEPTVISKLRTGKLPLGATAILRMHEVSNMSIADIKYMATMEACAA